MIIVIMKMWGLLVSWTQFTTRLQKLQLQLIQLSVFVCFSWLLSRQSTQARVLTQPSLKFQLLLLIVLHDALFLKTFHLQQQQRLKTRTSCSSFDSLFLLQMIIMMMILNTVINKTKPTPPYSLSKWP